jgi:ABC-2 type transport system ATP-binding protein
MAAFFDAAIDIQYVSKVYGRRVHALQGISLNIQRGEVFGLLGPNGAGKSTLIKIMMTVVKPTQVQGTLLGKPVGHKPTLAKVGYLPEHHRFPRYLTGRQTLEFFGALAGVDRTTRRRRASELAETVGMTAWADKKVGEYSKGMMQRIGLAQALMNDPDLVLLDEPTDGVDPVGRKDIREVLMKMRDQGKTVFINSHLLSELEMICNRVAILVGGRVARQGRIDDLNVDKQRYEIDVSLRPENTSAVRAAFSGTLSNGVSPVNGPIFRGMLPGDIWIEIEGGSIRVGTIDPGQIQSLLDQLRGAGLEIRRVQAVKPSLEDLYMEAVIDPATGKSAAAGAAMDAPGPAFPVLPNS